MEPDLRQRQKYSVGVLGPGRLLQPESEVARVITVKMRREDPGAMAVRLVAQQVHLQMLTDQMTVLGTRPVRWNS